MNTKHSVFIILRQCLFCLQNADGNGLAGAIVIDCAASPKLGRNEVKTKDN